MNEDPLVMGIFPRRNATVTIQMFTPLANHLSKVLGRKVQLQTTKDFDSFWAGVKSNRFDIVHFNQYHYMVSKKRFGYEVILKNEEFGKDTLAGALIVRKDSGINSIADIKGQTVFFGGGPKAMISYIVPMYLLQKGGVKKQDIKISFAKNPPNAVFGVFYKQAMVAGAGDVALNLGIVKKQIKVDELKILAKSKPFTHIPWAVKSNMDKALKLKIQSSLANLKQTETGRTILKKANLSGLNIAVDNEFDELRAIVEQVLHEKY